MNEEVPGSTSTGGLRRALEQVGVSFLDLVGTRLQLAMLEFAEQREKAKSALILILVATIFIAFAVLAVSALVVVYFWDTHRLQALAGVAVAHLAIGIGALWRLSASESATTPFAETLAEFERDRRWIAGETGRETGGVEITK